MLSLTFERISKMAMGMQYEYEILLHAEGDNSITCWLFGDELCAQAFYENLLMAKSRDIIKLSFNMVGIVNGEEAPTLKKTLRQNQLADIQS